MSDRLAGRVALITGGGRGIGRSIALAMAAHGAAVVIDDVFIEDDGTAVAEATAAEIRVAGGRAIGVKDSVTNAEGVDAMVAAAVDEYGRLDVLVNCAGNVVKAPLVDLTEDQWDSVMNLHLKGHFLACRAAVPQMLEQDTGRIVTVSSRGAFWDVPDNKLASRPPERRPSSVAYSAAKAGIMAFTTTLALELWDTGVTVNCLLPSANTQLFPGTTPNPVGGMPPPNSLDPEYIAPVIVYLATDEARHVSGRFIYASGGDVCVYPQPFQLLGGAGLVRKHGRWTVDELGEVLPSLVGGAAS